MIGIRRERGNRGWRSPFTPSLLAALMGLVLASGCALGRDEGEGPANPGEGAAVALSVERPLLSPAYDPQAEAVFALPRDGRSLVKLETNVSYPDEEATPDAIVDAEELEFEVGESLALGDGRTSDRIYVPVPSRDQVAVYEDDDMLEVRTFGAGESPVRLALHGDSRTIFALSRDGSTLTAVGLPGENDPVRKLRVNAGETARLAVSEEGDRRLLWVWGDGVAVYGGEPLHRLAESGMEAGSLAADDGDASVAYVAGPDSERVRKVRLSDEELQTVEEAQIGGVVLALAAEGERLFAVTGDEVVVLRLGEQMEVVSRLGLGPALEAAGVERAEPSGLAVGEEYVYVTLEEDPYVLLVERKRS